MKCMIKFGFALLFLPLVSWQNPTYIKVEGCKIMHEGTFKYEKDLSNDKVVIKGNVHKEYVGGNYVKSKLVWKDDCSFTMTITKVTIPDFVYPVGTSMFVQITEVEGKKVSYTSTVNNQVFQSTLVKQ